MLMLMLMLLCSARCWAAPDAGYLSWSTDRTLPAGSLNHAM